MIPSLAFATPTDVPHLFSELFATLPPETYDLALYFERTYIGRHMINSPIVVPPLFPIEMWNNHFMVQHSLPRTTNSIEAWHRSIYQSYGMSSSFDLEILGRVKKRARFS